MSDNMERDNESLAKEKEEEEMKKELEDMGMYEIWYNVTDMKQILNVISESKDMANKAEGNEDSMHSNNNNSDVAIVNANREEELEASEMADTPLQLHYHVSPVLDRISSQSNSSHSMFESRNSRHGRQSNDSDDPCEKVHDCQDGTHSPETKITKSEHSQKLERWRTNQCDSSPIDDTDVPLEQPFRPVVEDREPFRSCKDVYTSEKVDKLLLAINLHLKQMAELWHSWQRRTTNSKFQWGSPIQVETAKSSVDKKALSDLKTEQNKMERCNKRKTASILSSLKQSDSQDDDTAEFINIKKQRIQPYEGSRRILRSMKETIVTKDILTLSPTKDDEYLFRDDDKVNSDDSDTKTELPKNSENERLSPQWAPTYPRRIVPPNPSKYINRKRKHNNITKAQKLLDEPEEEEGGISLIPKKKSNALTNEEILVELENDNDSTETRSKNAEIKLLPAKKGSLSLRLEKQFSVLQEAHNEKQKKIDMEKEEAEKTAAEERRKREEFFKKQTEEREQREREKAELERMREERSRKWKSKQILNFSATERLRSLRDRIEFRDSETENNLFPRGSSSSRNDHLELANEAPDNNVNCPICNGSFPSDQIETHAAACEQYNTDIDEDNLFPIQTSPAKRNSLNNQILECNICSRYRTTNGIKYEEHTNNCLQQRQQPSCSYDRTTISIDNIPTSPVHYYRSISEISDSEIDYKAQFPTSKRRKR